MQNEIYKLIREFCISDTCAESAAEKVVEYLESKKQPVGLIAPDIIKELERLKGPAKVVVVNSPPPPLLENVRPEIFNVPTYTAHEHEKILNIKGDHKRKSSKEI